MKPEGAVVLNPIPNLSRPGLEDAALLLPAVHIFTLRISSSLLLEAKQLCKELGCDVKDNIFSPYLNIVVDDSYEAFEWSLSNGKHTVWSAGC